MKKISSSYNLLLNRKIDILLNNELYCIDFKSINLYHLLGIQYLTDMKSVQNVSKSKLLKKIECGEIDYQLLEKSVHFEKIRPRLENFYFLPNFLLSSSYIEYVAFQRTNPSTRLEFDYLLVHQCIKNENEYTCIGLRIDPDKKVLIPVSYFISKDKLINRLKHNNVKQISAKNKLK